MRISDWSSDVCSSDFLIGRRDIAGGRHADAQVAALRFLREIGGIVGTAEAIGEQRAKQDDNGGDHADFHPARPLLNAIDAQKGIERLAGSGKDRKSTRLNSSN